MKNKLVADGPIRFLRAKQKAGTPDSIRKKYTAELATAAPAERVKILRRMEQEISWCERTLNHTPSPATLW